MKDVRQINRTIGESRHDRGTVHPNPNPQRWISEVAGGVCALTLVTVALTLRAEK